MFLRVLLLALTSISLIAQETEGLEIDFLSAYYDQDGENSPVNGGVGDEALTSVSPIIALRYGAASDWQYAATIGLDNISSASIDSMDDNAGDNNPEVSSASKLDNRAFASFGASKKVGNNTWGASVGFSKEYDYTSINGGISLSRDFNSNNTNVALSLTHYADTIDLYSIHGVNEGNDDRSTTDISLSLTQVLSTQTVASVELFMSDQSGFLSSPFQEVILQDGTHVPERLPDSRSRTGVRLSLNHAFSDNVILRSYARVYDDDFGIKATTIELEPYFRLPLAREAWVYPVFRHHMQDGSDYWGLPGFFTTENVYYTVDRDLSEFDSSKYGVGAQFSADGRLIKGYDVRATYYDRDDGLTAFNISFGLRFSFK